MLTRLLTLVAVMVMIAAGWAFLVTLVSPPLTLGWRETVEATVRRSARYVAVLGIAGVGVLLVLALAARPWLVRLLGARHTPTTQNDPGGPAAPGVHPSMPTRSMQSVTLVSTGPSWTWPSQVPPRPEPLVGVACLLR